MSVTKAYFTIEEQKPSWASHDNLISEYIRFVSDKVPLDSHGNISMFRVCSALNGISYIISNTNIEEGKVFLPGSNNKYTKGRKIDQYDFDYDRDK